MENAKAVYRQIKITKRLPQVITQPYPQQLKTATYTQAPLLLRLRHPTKNIHTCIKQICCIAGGANKIIIDMKA